MQITPKETKGLTRQFSVVVPAKDVEQEMETELQSVGSKVKMPGFRPGKVPMNILKQRYGRDVMGDVLQNAVNKATREMVEKQKLKPAMAPDVKITEFEEGGDLSFDVTFEVLPDVPAIDFAKLNVDELTYEVPENEVSESLERLAKSRQHLHKEEGAAKQGHVVKIDFVGKKDGVAFAGGTGKDFFLELGSGQFIPGFEEQLVGAKAGDERKVNVTFPKEYHSKDLAGQPAIFDVTVKEVHHIHAPAIDEKLAKDLGFKDLESLKGAVRQQVGFEYEGLARGKAKKQLFDLLDEEIDFDVPPKMLTMEFDTIWKQVEEAKKAGDPSLKDKSEAQLKKEYEKIAKRRVKLGILLSEVGRANNLQISREELSAAVMSQARQFPGEEEKVFEFYRKNPAQVDELKGPILEEKAVDYILSKAKRTKKPISLEALRDEDESEASGGEEAKPKKAAAKKKA